MGFYGNLCVCVGGGVLIPKTIFHSTAQNPSGQKCLKRPNNFGIFGRGFPGVLCIERKTVSTDVQSMRSLLANLFVTNHQQQGNILYIE